MTKTQAKQASSSAALRESFARDPLAFGRAILRRRRWSMQKAMRLAIETHRRVHVQSGHSVGKTFELASIVAEFLCMGRGRRVLCMGPTYEQVKFGLWAQIKALVADCKRAGMPLGGRIGEHEWIIDDGWDARIVAVDNLSAAQGTKGSDGVLVVIDEAQGVDDAELWDVAESLMASPRSRLIACGNPLFAQGRFFEAATATDWHHIAVSCLDHPNVVTGRELFAGAVTRQWVEERRAKWGEDDPRWQSRVEGRFPTASSTDLFSRAIIDRATTPRTKDGAYLGIDVAGEGGDANVAMLVVDRVRVRTDEWAGLDPMGTVGRIAQLIRETGIDPQRVNVDASGLGAVIVSRLREIGLYVNGVQFGGAPTGAWASVLLDQRAVNMRTEMYLAAAQLFRDGDLSLGATDDVREDTLLQLVATKAHPKGPRSDGASRLVEKDVIKKSIGRSPDHADAFVLALNRTPEYVAWA